MNSRRKSSVRQFTLLIVAGVCFATLYTAFSPISFLRNPFATSITLANSARTERILPEVNELNKSQDTIIVDARVPGDFEKGHIPGAINLPVSCSLLDLKHSWREIENADTVVVYCQSSECGWSDTVGNRLRSMGKENVTIFRPGWMGYNQR